MGTSFVAQLGHNNWVLPPNNWGLAAKSSTDNRSDHQKNNHVGPVKNIMIGPCSGHPNALFGGIRDV
jgi:hypothetical protein